jgi:hypothetical protein
MVMEWKIIRRDTDLVTCSLCLRVRRGADWVEPEEVITELRSYELVAPPKLLPAIFDACADAIFDRRTRLEETVAV